MTRDLRPTVKKSLSRAQRDHCKVSAKTHTATVTYDDAKTSTAALIAATTNAGYPSGSASESIMSDCCNRGDGSQAEVRPRVVGGGSAGFSAAITAAEQGAQVAVIGPTIGGTAPASAAFQGADPRSSIHHANAAPMRLTVSRRGTNGRLGQGSPKDSLVRASSGEYADLLPSQ